MFACFAVAAASPAELAALAADDECLGEEQCSLNALQLRGTPVEPKDWVEVVLPNATEGKNATEGDMLAPASYGWDAGGGKMWGQGAGIESINYGNVAYYDRGMDAAHARCGGPGCALVVNPMGHRTVNKFHIHFIRYKSYGRSLKTTLEAATCTRPGMWQHGPGHFPCHGKAAFFSGSSKVFSEALRAGGGHISAGVIAWPGACGGHGTIVELAPGCSIEHQIRGDYNPHKR